MKGKNINFESSPKCKNKNNKYLWNGLLLLYYFAFVVYNKSL